ncbi:flagellar hook-length control protein FliK [Chitinimonas sp. BJYL2]|uniref:flagellar hook-length control protein FliK n=1 Tax=Chitinimonas sp. BJYL2 TaxID=2976696 RepID=UPI0022B44E38|nr:flagellar hook-length control protein FliK [Chitinimonas sp. BJYL2]
MPATSNTNQLLASLGANKAPNAGRSRPDAAQDGLFQASLDQQINQFRPESASPDAVAKPVSERERVATQAPERPAAKPATRQPERPDTREAAGPDYDKAAVPVDDTTTRPASERKGAPSKSGQDDQVDEEQAMATAAQATAIMQLQHLVNPAVEPAPEADATAVEGLLQGDAEQATTLAKLVAELNGKEGQLRQSLPAVAAKADAMVDLAKQDLAAVKEPGILLAGKDTMTEPVEDFSRVLESRLGAQSAGVVIQQTASQSIRVEPMRAQSVESSRGQMSIFQPVGGEGWDKALGTRMVMMVSNQQQEVEMQLNPPHLGPMEIKLTLDKDQASVTFVALHAPVREALQASMPKLSEMLAESGIQLADAQVQSQAQRDQAQGEQGQQRHGGQRIASEPLELQPVPVHAIRASMSMLTPGSVSLFV